MNADDMTVPAEYATQIKKLFPGEETLGLAKVLKKGISRVHAERRFVRNRAKKAKG